MAEYYKREDLDEALTELLKSPYANHETPFNCGVKDALKLVRDMVNGKVSYVLKIPTADVRENGECDFVDSGFLGDLICSACGEAVGTKAETQRMRFCPYCGKRRTRNEN